VRWDGDILLIGPENGPNLMFTTHWSWRPGFYADDCGWSLTFLWIDIGWWNGKVPA
jgi:hypothetical protein